MIQPIIYESHMHTPLCRHADGEPEEYAKIALRRGLKGMIVTCHNAMPAEFAHQGRMQPREVEEYVRIVERCRAAFEGRLDVRLGLEADYFPGYEAWVEKQLSELPLHHVLGSVHPQLPDWTKRYWNEEEPMIGIRHYFQHLADSAETGLFDTLAHPDLIKNMCKRFWDVRRAEDVIAASLDRIAKTGVAMELNTSGILKPVAEMNPCPDMLVMMRQRNIPVVVGADAHSPLRVAANYELAYELLEEAGYQNVSFFLNRKRQEISIADARASLIRPLATVK